MGNLVWLASYPKSGNTWLRAFIYNLIECPAKPQPLTTLTRYFESESDPRWYRAHLLRAPEECGFDQLISLRPQVHRDIANSRAHGSVLTKTHNQFTHYNGVPLHNLDVTAAAIYLVRNPLDVVISVADHFGLSLDSAIEFMRNPDTASGSDDESVATYYGSWSDHVESWSRDPHPSFLILKYEDLLDKPVATFTRVARLLGLEQDKARIKRAILLSKFKQLKQQELRDGFSERSTASKAFFRKGTKNQWIETLSEAQVGAMLGAHRKQMLRFDYVPPRYR